MRMPEDVRAGSDGRLFGGIEGGGTKFVCVVGRGPDEIVAETRIPTTTPDATLSRAADFFRAEAARRGGLAAVGVGSFGPVDLREGSATWGFITTTPKAGWAQTDVAGRLKHDLGVPVAFDTDVNAAAIGEARWGAAQGLDTFIYLTVGTGIGGGGLLGGQPMHGLVHPEMGHMLLPHDRSLDPFPGVCPFHGGCLEGLASGPALLARWGQAAESLPADHPAWALEARYLALALVNLVCTLSPQRIVMGGGVMEQAQLFPLIRKEVVTLLSGYIRAAEILDGIDGYIVAPGLGNRSGRLGALAMAERLAGPG
ncbi:MAG: ROK family protein [Rhodospirillaceae bacterium]